MRHFLLKTFIGYRNGTINEIYVFQIKKNYPTKWSRHVSKQMKNVLRNYNVFEIYIK